MQCLRYTIIIIADNIIWSCPYRIMIDRASNKIGNLEQAPEYEEAAELAGKLPISVPSPTRPGDS